MCGAHYRHGCPSFECSRLCAFVVNNIHAHYIAVGKAVVVDTTHTLLRNLSGKGDSILSAVDHTGYVIFNVAARCQHHRGKDSDTIKILFHNS